MCGIFGIIARDNSTPLREELEGAAGLLSHRGPDCTGIVQEPGFGFVHTRLSILDLNERSNQPFWDETNRYSIIYNGEIYNFEELRQRLKARGVRFRTTGDTEVLLQALIHLGEAVLPELMGMFAFCFYDRQTRIALFGRDRFGIKPFYYAVQANRVIFSSEQATIHHVIQGRPDMATIFAYLMGFGGPHRNLRFLKT